MVSEGKSDVNLIIVCLYGFLSFWFLSVFALFIFFSLKMTCLGVVFVYLLVFVVIVRCSLSFLNP